MTRPTKLTIDLDALTHNFGRVRAFAPQQKICAMVKANAYGHGLVQVATELKGTDAFGVASLEEGIQLRHAGIKKPILLMEGFLDLRELREASEYQFSLVVHHPYQIECLERIKISHTFPIWLKINTGMNRLGIDLDTVTSVIKRLSSLKTVEAPIGLMTHFSQADVIASHFTEMQWQKFHEMTVNYVLPVSLANSAAIMMHPKTHGDWVRPGLMLYGASPFKETTGLDFNLKPVMTLSSAIIAINEVKRGDRIGYGGTYEAPKPMRVGVVAIGYGDGYPQFAKNGTPVLVKNMLCSLVGRVSMDMIAVDVSDINDVRIGDPVTLWGRGLPAEWIAEASGTSAYEILTRMTPRPKIEIEKKIATMENTH